MKMSWQSLTLGLALAHGFAAAGPTIAASSPETRPTITIHVRNCADVDDKTLAAAERVATEIFRKARVESRWVDEANLQNQDGNSIGRNPTNLSNIQLRIITPTMAERLGLPAKVMGVAPGSSRDRQRVYLVFNRVKELAQRQLEAQARGAISLRASTEKILGEMIAHEIGHILLDLPSHPAVGIMRGPWDLKDLHDVAFGELLFTPQQVAVIRAEVVRRCSKQDDVEVASIGLPTTARER